MDSFKGALLYIIVFLPFKILDKFIEGIGILYGMLQYPFQQGMRKSQKAYKKISNG